MKALRLYGVVLVLSAFALPLEAAADPIVGGPSGTAAGAFGDENSTSSQTNPNGRTGALNYQLPITFPPARGLVQPSLAISYDSSSGDGEAGYGWRLSAPTISRHALTGAKRLGSDFQYGGSPLVKICDAGGACGPEAMPTWFTSGMSYYRLQADDSFMRFFYDPNAQQWTVQEKGGVLSFFGGVGAMEADPVAQNLIWQYRLAKQQDLDSNTIKYAYKVAASGKLYLTDIWDTAPALGGVSATTALWAHHTHIDWIPVTQIIPARTYTRNTWVDVAPLDQVVSLITVGSHTELDVGGLREIVRQYQFAYFPPATKAVLSGNPDPTVAPFTRHPFLRSVQMFGACGSEDQNEHITQSTQCTPSGPPVEFEYSQGTKGFLAGPPDWTGPHLNNSDVGLVDVNRDGFPDIVQGPGSGTNPAIYINQSVPQLPIVSAGKFVSQPVDMSAIMGGAISQRTHTPFAQNTPAFFANLDGAQTVLGGWGDAPLLRIVAGQKDLFPGLVCSQPSGVGDGCSNWQWTEFTRADEGGYLTFPGNFGLNGGWQWFADVDGDGYQDAFAQPSPQSTRSGVLTTAMLHLTQIATSGASATLSPFSGQPTLSVAPSVKATSTYAFVYQDVTGDGLVDLIWYDRKYPNPTPYVWPGDGTGDFGCTAPCTPLPNSPDWQNAGSAYKILFDVDPPNKFKPIYFVDVNGDNLADAVQTDGTIANAADGRQGWEGAVSLWVNTDGVHFACANPGSSHDGNVGFVRCLAGELLDSRGLSSSGQAEQTLPHPVTFADMDANGTTDLVVFGQTGVFYLPFSSPAGLPHSSPMRAPRPGLLTKIRGGLGASTEVQYATIQEVERTPSGLAGLLATDVWKKPWSSHVPNVEPVVTAILVLDTPTERAGSGAQPTSTNAPFKFSRGTYYVYRDPTYDPLSREFRGFERVLRQNTSTLASTDTLFWYSPCERGFKDPCPNTSTSYADDWKLLSGRPIRVDRYLDGGVAAIGQRGAGVGPSVWLSSTTYGYGSLPTLVPDGPSRLVKVLGDVVTTTYIYDTSLPVTQNAAPTVTPDGSSDVNSVDGPPLQAAARIIVTERHMDSNHPTEGNPRMVIERAAVDGSFVRSEGDRYTMYYPVASTGDWQWKTPVVSLSDSEYSPPEQVNNLYYDERGHLNEIQAPLNSSAGGILNRSNPWGEFSPSSPEAALYTSITLVHLDFGEWGNVIGERRGKAYTAFTYDPDFSQYVSTQSEYITAPSTDPQSGTSLDTSFKWDYRFGNKTSVLRAITTPTGTPGTSSTTDISLTTTSYDSVGRVRSVVGPASDGTAVGLADYEYGDPGAFNVPYVKTTRHQQKGETLSPTSYVFMNGLGEPVIALSNAATGDPQPWIMNSYVIRDGGGRAIGDIDPQFTSVTPGSVQTTLPTYPGPYASTASWDSFGRLSYASHNGHVRLRREYHPLEVRSFDGKRAPTMGTGAPQYASTITDGWGRVVRRAVVASESVQVDYKLNLAGQPTTITHSHGNGSDAIVRTIQYDAVGEPISSFEPNTGVKNFQWDGMGHLVGTSDARGCGVDIYHDNLYRIVAEDFSPCEANHAPYSPYVNDGSGAGAEVFYKYDAYEPGQIESSQLAALEAPQNAAGRVVSMRDRGAESRYDYDFAGRVVRSSRRVALPRATAADAVAFDGHWTDVYSVHNYAGTRVARMVVDPTTPTAYSGLTESTAINERGLPGNVTVAGGPVPGVVERWMYNADGTIPEVDLGDAATTKELRDYDELQRLTTLQVRRNAPAVWSTKTPDWTPPTAADGTNQVGPLVYLGMSYDEADNPLEITDDSRDALWPAGAKPVQDTVLGYDDRDRVISTTLAYSSGTDTFVSPNTPDGATPRPMPLQVPSGLRRAASITQSYDWNGNVKTSGDDQGLVFDRSLGTVVYDPAKPNQMTGTADGSVQVAHDPAGNVVNVEVVRAGPCEGGNCAQRFVYEWDELGQLSRAARYDFVDGDLLTSAGRYPDTTGISVLTPTVIITYEYTGSTRVRKSVSEFGAPPKHTLDLNEMWRVEEATADPNTTYTFDDSQLSTYVAGARVLKDGGPSPSGNAYHMFHELGDQLGSASLIIDHETSEVVERTSYYGHGAVDSDYRPRRWHEYRESFKFTGKEDDREVGLTFFGARYYSPYLKQWMSADPLNIDGLAGDPNPYAYVSGQTARLTDPDGLTGEEGSPPPPSNPEDDHGGCTSCGDGRTDGGGGGGGGGGGSADGAGGSGSGPQRNFPRPKIPDVVSRVATYKAAVLVGTLRELHSTASVLGATVSPIMIPVLAAQSGDKGLDKIQALAEKGLTPTMRKVAMVESKVGAAVITAVATSGAGTVIGGGRAAVTEAAAVAVEGGEGGGVTTLYRAISQAELRDLGASGTLRGGGNGLGNKFFAESAEDAAKWGREFFVHDKEPFFILRVRVSNAVASQLQRWRLLDEIGPARSAEGTVLELLNKNAVFDILGANPVVPPPTP